MTWSCIPPAFLVWRVVLAQDPGGTSVGLVEVTSYAMSNKATLGTLCSPNSHKTKYVVVLLSPLWSLNYSFFLSLLTLLQLSKKNIEVLPAPEPRAAPRGNKACTVLHPSMQNLLAPATITFWWRLVFSAGLHSWTPQYHTNKIHVIWNWDYVQTKE